MKTAIATDSNSGLTEKVAREAGVFVLPMPVVIGGELHYEGQDIAHPQLYDAMRNHLEVSTSQPSPGQLLEFWNRILDEGYDEIVYIPMSSGLSNSCGTAVRLSQDFGDRVHVVDNHRISVTQAESAACAVRLAREGMRARDIKRLLQDRSYDASIYITVDSMEYLKKGGRITPAVAAFAAVLNLKPVLTIQGDKLDAFSKVRGMKQAELKMIEAVRHDRANRFSGVPDGQLQIETAGTLDADRKAQRWLEQVREAFPGFHVSYVDLPCSIACHVGINAAGIGIFRTWP